MSEAAPGISPAALQRRVDRGDPVRVLDLRNRDEVDHWRLSGPAVTVTQRSNATFIQARVTDSVEEFVDHVTGDMPPRPANLERVVAVNLGRETVDPEVAFELELGPNNCAATPADD